MSSNIDYITTMQTTASYQKFFAFMNTHELDNASNENVFLQRLKVLSARSGQFVKFKVIDDGKYLVYTEHEVSTTGTNSIGQDTIDQLVPFRSAIIECDASSARLANYSINRVKNISNGDFASLPDDKFVKSVAMEGTVIVVIHDGNKWTSRTTSCYDGDSSYFNSDISHGSLFVRVASKMRGLPETAVLSDVMEGFDVNNYYVFLLVSSETCHLCKYDNDCVYLLNVRDTENRNVENTTVFKSPDSISQVQIDELLNDDSNKVFNNKLLSIQGFVATDKETGDIYRTYTNAYYIANSKIHNHSNKFCTFLHCYLLNSLKVYAEMKNLEDYDTIQSMCRNTVSGLRNLLAYLFSTFTNLTIENQPCTSADGSVQYRTKKSYVKRNGDLYTALFEGDADSKNVAETYKRVLAMLQGYALGQKSFNDASKLASDVEHFIRTLAYNQNKSSFKMVVTMLMNYEMFKTNLVSVVKSVNDRRKQSHLKNKVFLKEFNNNSEKDIVSFVQNINVNKNVEPLASALNNDFEV